MKRGSIKYYLSTFVMVIIFMIVLTIVSHSQGTYFISSSIEPTGAMAKTFTIFLYKDKEFVLGNYLFDMISIIVFPLLFTLLFVFIDFITSKLKSKKKKQEEREALKYDTFIDMIGSELNKTNVFNAEDFRHFRENYKFQECLKKLYYIYENGENESNSYFLVLRKFNKGTVEKKALEYLIEFTKNKRNENMNNNQELEKGERNE